MSNFKNSEYNLVIDKKYSFKQLIENIILEESLDEIATHLSFSFVIPDKYPQLSDLPVVQLLGIPYGGSKNIELWRGVLWTEEAKNTGLKEAQLDAYDLMKYLSESEDDELLPAGQTAAQRFKYYCSKWGISVGTVQETGVRLSKGVYHGDKIFSMIMSDLKETVAKGGKMFRPYMDGCKANLVEIGTNKQIFNLDDILDQTSQKRTLEGAVTKVKIIGESKDNAKAPVLAIETKDTDKYGTIQRIISNPDSTDLSEAREQGKNMLVGKQESFSASGVDINVIKAGDLVKASGKSLVVRSITHKLEFPGSMNISLGTMESIRREVYGS
jgi:hypothetical protein